jgi:hypothetical protein
VAPFVERNHLMDGTGGLAFGFAILLVLAVFLASYGLGVWALVDALRHSNEEWKAAGQDKALWVAGIIISFFFIGPWLSVLLYWLIARKALKAARAMPATQGWLPPQPQQWPSPPQGWVPPQHAWAPEQQEWVPPVQPGENR